MDIEYDNTSIEWVVKVFQGLMLPSEPPQKLALKMLCGRGFKLI